MKSRLRPIVSARLTLGALCIGMALAGCQQSTLPKSSVPDSRSAGQQERDRKAQEYIIQRREAARKASRTHTSH